MRTQALSLVLVVAGCRSDPAQETPAPAPSPSQTAEPATEAPLDPNDPFAPYPESSELCNRLLMADGRILRWRSWTTKDDWGKVSGYYRERAKGAMVKESTEKIEIAQSRTRVLTIYPAALASKHPQCDKPLAPEDKTVVMLSMTNRP